MWEMTGNRLLVFGGKMNDVSLKGYLKDIRPSHNIGDVEYDKAFLLVSNKGKEDIVPLCFKHTSNHYKDGDLVELNGNLRSHSSKGLDGKNKVDIYIFTYFDIPNNVVNDEEVSNLVNIDGRICKLNEIRTHDNNSISINFLLANNIFTKSSNKKLNSYIPIVCWGDTAKMVSSLSVGDKISIVGEFHSRTYKKYFEDGSMEIRAAYEVVANSVTVQ
jgi:hypothetical protein